MGIASSDPPTDATRTEEFPGCGTEDHPEHPGRDAKVRSEQCQGRDSLPRTLTRHRRTATPRVWIATGAPTIAASAHVTDRRAEGPSSGGRRYWRAIATRSRS